MFKFNKGNYENLRNDLKSVIWFDDENANVDDMCLEFENKLLDKCRQHIPMTNPNTNGRKPDAPWMTEKAKRKIKEKKEAYKDKIQNNCDETRLKYSRACNQVKWECRKAKREYEKKIAKMAKSNPNIYQRKSNFTHCERGGVC